MSSIFSDESWLQVLNDKTGDSIIMVSQVSDRSRVVLQDWGLLGINLALNIEIVVDPEKPLEIPSYLVLANGPDAYKDYEPLKDYRWQ